jgi:hypothetical protein
MAIIPAAEKVFMVSNSTNTTYSGSAALKAMQQWYTMQDVIDTVGGGGGTPTLQQVTDEGQSTTNNIEVLSGADSISTIAPSAIYTEDLNLNTLAELDGRGWLNLVGQNDKKSSLRNTNVTNENVILEFPDKPAGSYTIATTSDISSYQVFTALLTQSGGFNPLSLSSGAVQEGVSYRVRDANETADFSNVGGPGLGQAFDYIWFIATASATPNSYGNGQLEYNTGAPVVTVLENTIGDIWFTYTNTGRYSIISNGLFTDNKTTTFGSQYNQELDVAIYFTTGGAATSSEIPITTADGAPSDGYLQNTPIEIRVYN